MRGASALVAAGAWVVLAASACQRAETTKADAADCGRVADTLASFELGAAPTAEQRTSAVAKHRAACESTRVTAAEARCLAGARDTWAARACLPRMFAAPTGTGASAGCAQMVARMREAVQTEVGSAGSAAMDAVDKMLPVFREACEQDAWPAAVLDCIARAKPGDMTAFQACANQLPKEQQDKLGQRLVAQQAQQAQQAPSHEPAPAK